MDRIIRLGPEFLFFLMKQPGVLQRFLTEVQAMMAGRIPLPQVADRIRAKNFWRQLTVVYKEIRQILSVSVSFDVIPTGHKSS
jgi:hypothetical protein